MNFKDFLEAESKNSIVSNKNSTLGKNVISQIKAVIASGKKAGVVIQGKAYWVEKKDGDISLTKMTKTDFFT